MDNLIPEIQPVNADSLFPGIIEEGQTWLRRWGEQRMIRLYDKAMDDLLDRATEWDYAPERIGAIGFSAGDRIAIELTIPSDPEIRLAFVASIYGVLFSDMIGDGSVHQLASVFLPVFPLCSWLSL